MTISSLVRFYVTKISDVANFLEGATVGHFEWVVMWAGSSASFKKVAVLVNVEAVFVARCQASEISFYRSLRHH
jgi:hypothetical protein